MKEIDECLDSQLWHACAGGMVQMPLINSKVYYFPQGHAEHVQSNVDFSVCSRIPALIPCRVAAVKFMADPDTDEVFAKLRLVPLRSDDPQDEDDEPGGKTLDAPDKLASFSKTLTQSDANNGGGFSIPRYCAETIFPRLDYSAEPPVQTVLAKDVHGEVWKFRHIYRGTPRRHLLTTGWSMFVNQKRLVAGDSVVFLRAENGDLCIGIRRAKRGISSLSGWNCPAGNCLNSFGDFSMLFRGGEKKLARSNVAGVNGKGRMRAESVIEAVDLASRGQPFEVTYYPRASTPEFCVKASLVRTAMRTQWCFGMRFKMAFETEDSSRISWFMGTISAIQVVDPIRWPNSPWRLLQVSWDEPDLLQNVKRVSPWLVEFVPNAPAINLSPFSSQRKKLRLSQSPDFVLDGQLLSPTFPQTPLRPSSDPMCFLSESTPAGIQGARHTQFGITLSDLHFDKLQTGLFPAGFHHLDHRAPVSRISTGVLVRNPSIHEKNISCDSHTQTKSRDGELPKFVLFGKPILTEKEILLSNAREAVSPPWAVNSSSDVKFEKALKLSRGHDQAINLNRRFMWGQESNVSELSLETGLCKVLMESEDAGRTLNLSVLGSYDELNGKLSAGTIKHTGEEPFGDFTRPTRRLAILSDSEIDNSGG